MDDLIFPLVVFLAFFLPLALMIGFFVRLRQRREAGGGHPGSGANFVAAIGGLFLVGGSILAWMTLPLAWADGTAEGTVVSYDTRHGRKGRSTTHAPVVEFMANGKLVRFASSLSSSPPSYALNTKVPVRFDPAKPERAEIDAWHILWAPLIFPVFGLLITIGALAWAKREGERVAMIQRLRQTGTPVEGEITSYRQAFGNKHRQAFRYIVRWTDALGRPRQDASDKVWGGPYQALVGRNVRVLTDPASPKEFYVEMDPLIAELAPEDTR